MNLMNSFSFELPTRIEYGPGVTARLPRELHALGVKHVLLVTDPGVASRGLMNDLRSNIMHNGIEFEIFDHVESNPKDYNVEEGTAKALATKVDGVVAVGGGSPIDCAKAICVVATNGGKPRDYEGKGKIATDPLPLIAVPTTAGSASEVTFSSVVTDTTEKFKFSIKDPRIAPVAALADPEMTRTMPPALTAATGMDALTHAIEGYTAKVAEPLSDAAALHAIEMITSNLRAAVEDGENLEARAGMLIGSILAGIAFSHSDVGSVHCIAEALGGKYDLPHGVCNAVCLPAVMEYNQDYCLERYARVAGAMGMTFASPAEGARLAVSAVAQLARDIQLPDFARLGVKAEDLEELAHKSEINGSNPDNPRPMAKEDSLYIFEMLGGEK